VAISGLGVAYTLGGFVLLYSGYANQPIKSVLTGFLSGKPPAPNPTGSPEIGVQDNAPASSSGGSAGTTSSGIANDALQYQGQGYVWGGNASKPGDWDCSSFVSYVLGHDLGMALPGGHWGESGFPPSTHGPTTLSYLSWSGAKTIGNNPASAQAGDLCVWQSHMGIATGGGNMVSALDEAEGTKQTTIKGGAPSGEILFVRRITAAT
jgi:cell wall-associated NlpC family hydrolase